MAKKRVVVDSDEDDDDNLPLAKRPSVAPSEEEEDLFGDMEPQAPPKRSSAVSLELDEDDYALVEENTGVAMERSASRKQPSARGLPTGAVAAQREAIRKRFGEGAQASGEQNGTDVPLDANGRPKKPEATWARWGRGEDDGRRPDPNVYAPASPTDAGLLTLVPPHWLQDDEHAHLVPKEIPKPPAHLVEGTGARPRIPAKPKLPTHHRTLTRPAGCLRPYTHPFAVDEVAVIRRSDRYQNLIEMARTHMDVVSAMGQLAREAKKLMSLDQSPMTYWFSNIQAEVASRGLGKPNGSTALIAAWDKSVRGDIFTGLMRLEGDNLTVCPVEYDLYLAERKPQEEENAKAQQQIDAWEAKYGDAWQTHEQRCGEWRKHAAEKGAAVAYREYAAKDEHDVMPSQYRFYQSQVMMGKQSSHKDFSYIMQPPLSALLDKVRHLRTDGEVVISEAQRYYDNRKHVPPFKAKLMLRNAIGADKEYRDRITKEMDSVREFIALSESWVKELREHQNQWVMAERIALESALEKINATGEREMCETLKTAYAYGYVCTDKALEKWPGAAWTKPYEDGVLSKALAVEDELLFRIGKVGSFLSDHRWLYKELEAKLREYARLFKPLPGLDDADASSNNEEEEEEDVVFTREVTREERDAMGRAQAEVLD